MATATMNTTTGIVYVRSISGTLSVTNVTASGVFLAANGTGAAPSYGFSTNPNTGLFHAGTGASSVMSISINGATAVQVDSAAGMYLASAGAYRFVSRLTIQAPSDGVVTFYNAGTTDFARMQFGGTTSSFPALKRAAATLDVRLADDSAYTSMTALSFVATSRFDINGKLTLSATAPTISSAFGTSPTIAANNGTAAFTINVGTGGTATTGVIGLPAATTGWIVNVQNLTAQAANRASVATVQTASTTTTATIQNQNVATGAATAWAASDVLSITAVAY